MMREKIVENIKGGHIRHLHHHLRVLAKVQVQALFHILQVNKFRKDKISEKFNKISI